MSLKSLSQEVTLVPHYPKTAYVVERLIPFSAIGADVNFVESVKVENGESCKALVDPFYRENFHLYCQKPEQVNLLVNILTSKGLKAVYRIEEIVIRQEMVPAQVEP